ncbi:transcription cofactor HES-6-like [Heterodontus francisci]|uniref:transcription cofactor HES-6-like n=1 Tax=Heterodontus francisci TaxID=7792 RepID=UPI00355AD7E9
MAPSYKPSKPGSVRDEGDYYTVKEDRKTRKPLIEKKRRARINESLQELRLILADTELQSKMENAEVLEMTVKRVQSIVRNRNVETERFNQEANERFAAGYIQCMHEVHTFVSNCPGIDSAVAAELLNHLLESMPLSEDHFQDLLGELMAETGPSMWPGPDDVCHLLVSPGGGIQTSPSALSPLSTASSDDLCSDLDEADSPTAGQSSLLQEKVDHCRTESTSPVMYSKSVWRPW